MKFVLSIVLTATLMLCALSLIFAAYPNQTSPYSGGFEVTPLNIFLYCLSDIMALVNGSLVCLASLVMNLFFVAIFIYLFPTVTNVNSRMKLYMD